MTPSEYCKSKGLTGLKQVADITGVKYRTLINWYKNKNKLFFVVVEGCRYLVIRSGGLKDWSDWKGKC